MDESKKLATKLEDKELIRYFYLDKSASEVLAHLDNMKLDLSESQNDVPFNAQVKGYIGAKDEEGDPWLVKAITTDEEMLYHRSCLFAYLLDHKTGTLAAPTSTTLINGKKYRITKVVQHAIQISSYNYLESPFIDALRADLINRWIYFDEDRNPNNYLVVTNPKNKPFVVAIDYDKADIFSKAMKITGTTCKFGWHRTEKTRFLTLLRPEHFEGISINVFEERLKAFTSISAEELHSLANNTFNAWSTSDTTIADKVVANIMQRREYVDTYFRTMFKSAENTVSLTHDEDYSAFGASFLAMHNKNK